jgi:hypothetical protein
MMTASASPDGPQADTSGVRTQAARPGRPHRLARLALAWLGASAWGSVAQTQFNLNALAALDVPVPALLRLQTTAQDLLGFGPAYAALVAAAWLPALAVAMLLGRRWPTWRSALFTAAGGLGLVTALKAVDAVAPMPVLIDATRGPVGLGLMALGCAVSAGLYAHTTRVRQR